MLTQPGEPKNFTTPAVRFAPPSECQSPTTSSISRTGYVEYRRKSLFLLRVVAMMRRIAFAVFFALLSLTAYAGRERPEYDKTFFEPCERVVTPHIPWAKPFAGKKIRVLYITHRNAMREAVEIAQRLSMDYKVFATEQWNKLGESGIGVDRWWRRIKGNSAEELAERLRRDLRRSYDLIVIANVSWDILPLDCQYEILKKVRAGAGLVGYVQMSKDSYLKRAVEEGKIEPTPEGLRNVVNGLPFAFLPAFSEKST